MLLTALISIDEIVVSQCENQAINLHICQQFTQNCSNSALKTANCALLFELNQLYSIKSSFSKMISKLLSNKLVRKC